MGKKIKTRRGRPLKGDKKRVRTSFTLPPDQIRWLGQEAKRQNATKSDLLSNLISDQQYYKSEISPVIGARFPISKKTLGNFCEKHHIIKFSLFGSILGNRFEQKSDIDVLVEFDSKHIPSLFELSTMERELSDIFEKRKIDIKTPGDLSRYFKDEVLREAEILYAA